MRSALGLAAGLMIVPSLAIIVPGLYRHDVSEVLIMGSSLVVGLVFLAVMLAFTLQMDDAGTYPDRRGKHRA